MGTFFYKKTTWNYDQTHQLVLPNKTIIPKTETTKLFVKWELKDLLN